jgi:hypothetical protein
MKDIQVAGVTTIDLGMVASSLPGVVAMLGAAIGYGRLTQRINDVEKALDGAGGIKTTMTRVEIQVARIEERGKAADSKLDAIDNKLDKALDRISNAASVATLRYHNTAPE